MDHQNAAFYLTSACVSLIVLVLIFFVWYWWRVSRETMRTLGEKNKALQHAHTDHRAHVLRLQVDHQREMRTLASGCTAHVLAMGEIISDIPGAELARIRFEQAAVELSSFIQQLVLTDEEDNMLTELSALPFPEAVRQLCPIDNRVQLSFSLGDGFHLPAAGLKKLLRLLNIMITYIHASSAASKVDIALEYRNGPLIIKYLPGVLAGLPMANILKEHGVEGQVWGIGKEDYIFIYLRSLQETVAKTVAN